MLKQHLMILWLPWSRCYQTELISLLDMIGFVEQIPTIQFAQNAWWRFGIVPPSLDLLHCVFLAKLGSQIASLLSGA